MLHSVIELPSWGTQITTLETECYPGKSALRWDLGARSFTAQLARRTASQRGRWITDSPLPQGGSPIIVKTFTGW